MTWQPTAPQPPPLVPRPRFCCLLFFLLVPTSLLAGSGSGTLALDAAGAGATKRGGESKVDVLLRVETDDKGWDVDDLLADSDVSLPDQDTRVVDGLCQARLEDLGLQSPLQEILNLECKHVIEPHAGLIEHTNAHKTTDKGVTLEKPLGVLVIELEELTGGTTDLGQNKSDTPDFTLVAEAVFASELELGIQTGTLERPPGDLVGLAVIPRGPGHVE